MKKIHGLGILIIFFCTLLIFSFRNSKKKDFEGIVKYSVNYYPKSDSITVDELIYKSGDTSIVYIKNGNYKQVYKNSKFVEWVLYENRTNRYYTKIVGYDTLYFINAGNDTLNYKVNKMSNMDTVILGHECQCIEMTSGYIKSLYYYTPSLNLSSKHFRNHKLGGYNLLTNNIESVFLFSSSSLKEFDMTITAFEINEIEIDKSIFNLTNYPKIEI